MLAERFAIQRWQSETHVIVALWSAEVLHALRSRSETFRALCPDEPVGFAGWWRGQAPAHGTRRELVVLDPLAKGSTTHSRGFSLVAKNIVEDPATGSASGCLGAYLVEHGLVPRKRAVRIVNEQGYEIGRPSRIDIEVVSEDGRIEQVMVGGSVVHMMDGHAYL